MARLANWFMRSYVSDLCKNIEKWMSWSRVVTEMLSGMRILWLCFIEVMSVHLRSSFFSRPKT